MAPRVSLLWTTILLASFVAASMSHTSYLHQPNGNKRHSSPPQQLEKAPMTHIPQTVAKNMSPKDTGSQKNSGLISQSHNQFSTCCAKMQMFYTLVSEGNVVQYARLKYGTLEEEL
ncbi:hypothetical protein BJV77DRAFT_962041 [Russula vinacea]|nr:hypothetical protein BJV77DRAFT_962041 [Russula vinacea]